MPTIDFEIFYIMIDLPKPLSSERDCAVEATIAVISGKWKPILLFHLYEGAKRYSELHRLVPRASERMLVRSLRELEQDNLVQRVVFPSVPVRVDYSLTDEGKSLVPVLEAMSIWGNKRQCDLA